MRALATAALVVVLAGCPAQQGPEGPQGPLGAQGAAGPAGATGPQGPAGADGAPGATGAQGPRGADGATGPQGVQGPQGVVLVVDGGVVVGPPGSSVVVTPIAAGATCATGGVRVTQLSDGGISNVCNGAVGPSGPQGPAGATGPQGSAGPAGAPGVAGVSASALSVMSAQCPNGGVLLTFADAGTSAVCNGAQGATGATGATGAAGPAGPAGATGPQGPQGPAGPALLLDGGVITFTDNADGFTFAGFTAATYDGNLGGFTGANQKCSAEFAGAHLCTIREYNFTGSFAAAGALGAWIDDVTFDTGFEPRDRSTYWTCRDWRSNDGPNTYMKFLDAQGSLSAPGYQTCNVARPLACCRSPHRAWFRGFTTATYDGNLGGVVGAAAKCRAEFPGSHFCTIREFEWAAPATAAGATGAWIDDVDRPGSTKYDVRPRDRDTYWTCRDWRSNDGPNTYMKYLDAQGSLSAPAYQTCNVARQLACCGP